MKKQSIVLFVITLGMSFNVNAWLFFIPSSEYISGLVGQTNEVKISQVNFQKNIPSKSIMGSGAGLGQKTLNDVASGLNGLTASGLTSGTPTYSSTQDSFEENNKKCEEIGFKTGTEAFGNCVLKFTN